MRIAELLRSKGTDVATIGSDARVTQLLAGLAEQNIGAMIVLELGNVAGIVSERDVVRGLHEHGPNVLTRPVAEIMTRMVASCALDDPVDDLSKLMTERRVRHVPVLADGELQGIVSIGDVVKTRLNELEENQEHLEAYIAQG